MRFLNARGKKALLSYAALLPDKAFVACVLQRMRIRMENAHSVLLLLCTECDFSTHAAKALLFYAALHPDNVFFRMRCAAQTKSHSVCTYPTIVIFYHTQPAQKFAPNRTIRLEGHEVKKVKTKISCFVFSYTQRPDTSV
jgi:hypothetical protein